MSSIRHYRLSRRLLSSSTHSLTGDSSAHPASVPRRPRWAPNEQAGRRVLHLSLPGLRCGVTMISSSSFVNCHSKARLERLMATLPLDGEFELEEVYRRRGHPKDVAVYRWHKAAGSRTWTAER